MFNPDIPGMKKRRNLLDFDVLAEATRFELVVRLPVRQFSKLVVSATHPNFLTLL